MDVSTLWLWWIILPWTSVYSVLCGHIFSFLLGIYVGLELLDLYNSCLDVWETAKQFPRLLWYFIIPTVMYEGCSFCIFLPTRVIICLFDYSHQGGEEWYLIRFSFCISVIYSLFLYSVKTMNGFYIFLMLKKSKKNIYLKFSISVSINKVLGKYSLTNLFLYCLWLPATELNSYNIDCVAAKHKMFTVCSFTENIVGWDLSTV